MKATYHLKATYHQTQLVCLTLFKNESKMNPFFNKLFILNMDLLIYVKNQRTDSPKSLLACKVLMECCVSSMQTQYMQRR